MVSAIHPNQTHAWCLFRSMSQAFAVPLDYVAEVVAVDQLLRLPLSPAEVIGLCTIRREVVPVVGLWDRAAGQTEPAGTVNAVLVLRAEHGLWGIGINREGITVMEGSPDSIEPSARGSNIAGAAGTIRRGDLPHTIIHPERAWATLRTSIEGWYARLGFCTASPLPAG